MPSHSHFLLTSGSAPNSRQHKRTDGIKNHRLIINRKQLFANALGYRVKSGAGAIGQDNS